MINSYRLGRNIIVTTSKKGQKFAMISDVHWDNPHCDRKLFKAHLDKCLEENIHIALNGDTFCLMQGKYDPRRSKNDIRPEHNKANYLDAVVDTAIEFFAPYAHLIVFVGYGNHETGIIKNCETDVIERFVSGLNRLTGSNVLVGGYGGWWIHRVEAKKINNKNTYSLFKIKYYHGSGGGGVVTKGVIQNNRMQVMIESADCIWSGHVHELYHHTDMAEEVVYSVSGDWRINTKYIHHIRTASYKEEYDEGYMGFHVERMRPPKPLGCYVLELNTERIITPIDTHIVVPNFVQWRDK
jgi:UDP-2,3-diacylglucosamine pyrophosphatase LpxH